MVAVAARALVVLDLEQLDGPGRLAGGRHHPQAPVAVGQDEARGRSVEELDGALGEQGHQVDHVEVVDEGVGQLDERPGKALLSRHPSFSFLTGAAGIVGKSSGRRGRPSLIELQPAADHVGGDRGQGPLRGIGMCAKPHQRLPHVHPELHAHHPRGLVHLGPVAGQHLQLRAEGPLRGAGLHRQDGVEHDARHHQGVGVLVVGEAPRRGLVERERAQADRAEAQREREQRARAGRERRRAEGDPAAAARPRQVGLHHRPAALLRIDPRPLAQRVLEILQVGRQGFDAQTGVGMPSTLSMRLIPATPSTSTPARQRLRPPDPPSPVETISTMRQKRASSREALMPPSIGAGVPTAARPPSPVSRR